MKQREGVIKAMAQKEKLLIDTEVKEENIV
jgi:hypothetical protein